MSLPQRLGKYEIRRELGRGAMGVVYEGWDPGIQRRVAIKTVRRDQLESSEAAEILQRFQREAQAAGRLAHPNIVGIYDFGEDVGAEGVITAYIAMEFVDGRELKSYFDSDERFPLAEVKRLMGELLAALGHAHKHGIVHRDIKPANVILLADGTVKVADFGIARIESSNLTQAGAVLGTPSYMSPEQFMGQTVDGRSDLFSAGVILYQFLTGDKPFAGTVTTIMHKVLKEDPVPPSELNFQIPRSFDAVLRHALAKRPDERYQSAAEFAEALMENPASAAADATVVGLVDATVIAGAAAVAAPVVPAVAQAQPAVMTPAPSPQVPPVAAASAKTVPPPQPPRRSKLPVAVAAAVALLSVGVGGWYLWRSGGAATGELDISGGMVSAPSPTQSGLMITAVGYADPSDPRYAQDQGLMQADLRADVRRQLVEKAAALYLAPESMAENYGLIDQRLLSRSNEFIASIEEEPASNQNKDGFASLTARANVKVRAVQKSLNEMSRGERIDFIRNNGDPKIAIRIATRSADAGESATAQPSPVAENLLKERIRSFGFRIVGDAAAGKEAEDFTVSGEAKLKKLSAKLEASGITIEKYVLTSWTVKCLDRKTGEEIYHNTQIPEKQSWATEDQALKEIGQLVGDEFSKNFFLQHFDFASQKVMLKVAGLPGAEVADALLRELKSLRPVLGVAASGGSGGEATYQLELSGGLTSAADLVANGILAPLNRKLGKTCLNVAGVNGAEVAVRYEASCGDPQTRARFGDLPPAALMTAPPTRREAVIRNPETLKRIQI